ncbi:MAG TPA: hypothetical protein VFW87_07340 [Pirellulales bacterium]|nr:hypothetical protein [Pirellulales bacterium]
MKSSGKILTPAQRNCQLFIDLEKDLITGAAQFNRPSIVDRGRSPLIAGDDVDSCPTIENVSRFVHARASDVELPVGTKSESETQQPKLAVERLACPPAHEPIGQSRIFGSSIAAAFGERLLRNCEAKLLESAPGGCMSLVVSPMTDTGCSRSQSKRSNGDAQRNRYPDAPTASERKVRLHDCHCRPIAAKMRVVRLGAGIVQRLVQHATFASKSAAMRPR